MTTKSILTSLLTLLTITLCASSSFADDVNLKLKKLQGQLQNGQLVVNYKLGKKSWSKAQALQIKPRLNMYMYSPAAFRRNQEPSFLYSFKLNSAKGSFTLPKRVAPRRLDVILEVEMVGFEREHRISGTRFKKDTRSSHLFIFTPQGRLTRYKETASPAPVIPTQPVQPPPPANWRVKVVKACNKAITYSPDVGKCVGAATTIRPAWAEQSVRACGDVISYTPDRIKCVQEASRHTAGNPADTLRACDKAISYTPDKIRCLEATRAYITRPEPIISACSTISYTPDRMKCIQLGAKLDASAPKVIRACKGSGWESCVRQAFGL